MRRTRFALALLLLLAASFSALSAKASSPLCYRIRVAVKGSVLVDRIVGFGCTGSGAVISVVEQRVGDTTIRTIRYAG
jgi:hypothetical protein